MQTKTISSRMQSLLYLYDMQSSFFERALAGISNADAHDRLNTKANHIAWLAGSLVEQRFFIARHFGSDLRQAGHDLFVNNKGIKDNITYPTMEQYKTDWNTIKPVVKTELVNVNDGKLDGELDMDGMKMNLYDLLAFTIYREAACIGQIALWRRLLGYEAMKYD